MIYDPRVEEIEILIATDVTNPLTGNNGASYVFGPQKGATEEMVKVLDENLKHMQKLFIMIWGKMLKINRELVQQVVWEQVCLLLPMQKCN